MTKFTKELIFEHTEDRVVELIRRYLGCFDNKLAFFGYQVAEFCEKISSDSTLKQRFSEDSNPTNLHICIERFMMSVLKAFLQSIDEGLADIIDELEDNCADHQDLSMSLKKLVFEFQQVSFQRRERMASDYKEKKEETGKSSMEWFDSFFGDVTTLLKNPINRNLYSKEIPNYQASESPNQTPTIRKLDFPTKGEIKWSTKENIISFGGAPDQHQAARGRDDSQDDVSSFGGAGAWGENLQPAHSSEQQSESIAPSEGFTLKINFSQEDKDYGSSNNLSSTKSATNNETTNQQRKSVDLKEEDINFEEVFLTEKFPVDGSSKLRSYFSVVYSTHIESPNCMLVGTDQKKLYRMNIQSKHKDVVFSSKPCN